MKSVGVSGVMVQNGYLLFDKSGGQISIGESIDEAVLVMVGLDRIVFTLTRGKQTQA